METDKNVERENIQMQVISRKEEEACVLQLKHTLNVHHNECGVFA